MSKIGISLGVVLFALYSCSNPEDLLIGKWKKVKSERRGIEDWSFRPAILIFKENKTFEAGKFSLDNSKTGTWHINETNDSITLTEENNKYSESLRIVKITQDSLILTDSEFKSYFKKQ